MKNLKKLHVAVAVASLFAAGNSMALAISQSGVTIAREVISVAPTSTQSLLAPSVSINFINGPTANALSSQDFSITLELASSAGAPAVWTNLVLANIWRTVNAKRQSNGAITKVISSTDPALATEFIRVLDVQLEPGTSTAGSTVRYFFRLENPTAAAVSLSDLALEFNSVNATTAPLGLSDYARIGSLNTAVAAIIGSRVGSDGTAPGCANDDSRLTVRAKNFIGSGFTAPEGESSGSIVLNNGYVLFAQALNIRIGRAETGVINIPNRNTDVSTSNTGLTIDTSGFGAANRMTMGFIKFSRVPVDAWDLSVQGNYYSYRKAGGGGTYGTFTSPVVTGPGSQGDLGTFTTTNISGNIDVAAAKVVIKSSNGFAAGSTFSLTNNPFGTTGAAGAAGTNGGAVGTTVYSNDPTGPVGNLNIATVTFSHANLEAAANLGVAGTLLGSTGTGPTSTVFYPSVSNDRFYINYITSGSAIPQSTFTGTVMLIKETDATNGTEQDNLSCVGELAGLGGGLKIDVRNFYPYNPADTVRDFIGVLRVINNSESVDADLTGQYIRADGKYGKWGSMGILPARGARYFLNNEIFNLLNQNTNTTLPKDNSGSGGLTAEAGAGAQPPNTRIRISSASASTLRVQSYIYSVRNQALVEVSGSQGADFDTYERTTRDSIEQDAQTGIKK
jgi:hypothetical protein